MTDSQCRHCKQPGNCPEIVPYWIGKHIWLHPHCAPEWFRKYREWINERRAEKK